MIELNNAMFIVFDQDEIIYPPESSLFGEVQTDANGKRQIIKMEDTDFYK